MFSKKLISLGLLVSLLFTMLPGTVLAQATRVIVQPGSQTIAVGETATVTIRIENVTGLIAAEVHLTFTPGIVQVVDADANTVGIQVAPGDIFAGKNAFTAQNVANNTNGTIDYAIAVLGVSEPGVTGSGDLIRVTFRGSAQGLTAIAFSTTNPVLLAGQGGATISASTVNGAITVTGAMPTATVTPTATATSVPPTATPTATTPPGATPTPTRTATPMPGGVCTYVVQWGDTLYSIARRYNTTVSVLVSLNGIANPNYIRTGQVLYVPCVVTPTPVPTVTVTPGCLGFYYTVVSGDTLYGIARRFGTTLSAILAVNYIPNPNFIYVGQRICIPGVGPTPTPPQCRAYYTVQPGDTLIAIAARYGTTYWAIAIANNISNPNLIYPGRTLCIP